MISLILIASNPAVLWIPAASICFANFENTALFLASSSIVWVVFSLLRASSLSVSTSVQLPAAIA